MKATHSYSIDGTSALAPHRHEHLRLVYDSNRDCRTTSVGPAAGYRHLLACTFVLLLIAGMISTVVDNARHAAAQSAISSGEVQTVCIAPGDTLWSIAEEHEIPGTSTEDVVEWIKKSNGLSSSALMPGQRLVIPLA